MHKLFQSVPVSVRPFLSVTLIVIAFVFAIISGCSHWYGMTQEKNGMRVTTLFNWDEMTTYIVHDGETTIKQREYHSSLKTLYGGTHFEIIMGILCVTALLVMYIIRTNAIKPLVAQIPYNEVAINIADNDQIRSILIIAAFIWYFFAIFFFSIRHPTCLYDDAKVENKNNVPPRRDYYDSFSGTTKDGIEYGPGPGWSVTLFPGLVLIMALLVVDVVYERNHRAGCTSNDDQGGFTNIDEENATNSGVVHEPTHADADTEEQHISTEPQVVESSSYQAVPTISEGSGYQSYNAV